MALTGERGGVGGWRELEGGEGEGADVQHVAGAGCACFVGAELYLGAMETDTHAPEIMDGWTHWMETRDKEGSHAAAGGPREARGCVRSSREAGGLVTAACMYHGAE